MTYAGIIISLQNRQLKIFDEEYPKWGNYILDKPMCKDNHTGVTGRGQKDTEITPDMIKAGVEAIYGYDWDTETKASLAIRVYEAMNNLAKDRIS